MEGEESDGVQVGGMKMSHTGNPKGGTLTGVGPALCSVVGSDCGRTMTLNIFVSDTAVGSPRL